jgi:hypothetical protein
MPAKMETKVNPVATPASRNELEYLYARRSAIDNLIESLENYARFAPAQAESRESQTA